MRDFYWNCPMSRDLDTTLYALADQLILVEDVLRLPDQPGVTTDTLQLSAGGAAGLATLVMSIEQALREIASVLAARPRGARPALVRAFEEYIRDFPDTQPYLTKLFVAVRRQQFSEWQHLHEACCCEQCLAPEDTGDADAAEGAA